MSEEKTAASRIEEAARILNSNYGDGEFRITYSDDYEVGGGTHD